MGKKRKNPFAKKLNAEEPKIMKKIRRNSNKEIVSEIQNELDQILPPIIEDQPKEFETNNLMELEENEHQDNNNNKIDDIKDIEALKILEITEPSISSNHNNTLTNGIDDNILQEEVQDKEKDKSKSKSKSRKHKGKGRNRRKK